MRYAPINPELFKLNRERLKNLMLKNSLAVVNANDVMPSNADGTLGFRQNSDLFYLTGVDQEETILLLFPNASDEKMREVLFVRETSPLIATWEAGTVRETLDKLHERKPFMPPFVGLRSEKAWLTSYLYLMSRGREAAVSGATLRER